MLEISSEIRNQSDELREGNRENLLDNTLKEWKLLLGCHVGRQWIETQDAVRQEQGLDTELGWWRTEVVRVIVLGNCKVRNWSRWRWEVPSCESCTWSRPVLNCARLALIDLKESRNYIL